MVNLVANEISKLFGVKLNRLTWFIIGNYAEFIQINYDRLLCHVTKLAPRSISSPKHNCYKIDP